MKRTYGLVVGKMLVFAAGLFLTLAISGCGDQVVKDFEANRQRMGRECQQDLQHAMATFSPPTQIPTFQPAP